MSWETFSKSFMEWLPGAGVSLAKLALVIFVGFLLLKFGITILRKVLHKTKLDLAVVGFILSITKAIISVVIFLLGLDAINLPITAITASLGAFSVGITVALKDTMSSLASGINIIVNKPFKNGDFVEIAKYEGTISEIRMMSTELVTFDNKTIIIPNSVVSSSPVLNYTFLKERRIDLNISIAYESDIKYVRKIIEDALKKDKRILVENGITVGISNFEDSAILLVVKFWVEVKDFFKVRLEVKEELFDAFRENQIVIPFNQLDVKIKDFVEQPEAISKIDNLINKKMEKAKNKEIKYQEKLDKNKDSKK